MEIVCEGTLEDCVKWYFDVNFCENVETMWGNEEGFMVEDFDRYMDMTVRLRIVKYAKILFIWAMHHVYQVISKRGSKS